MTISQKLFPPRFYVSFVLLCFSIRVVLVLFPLNASFAEEIDPASLEGGSAVSRGRVCVGYEPASKTWGYYPHAVGWHLCPPHYAIMGAARPPAWNFTDGQVPIDANCCPLPRSDILSEHSVKVDSECPENHVVTGTQGYRKGKGTSMSLRCTKINIEKYTLGPRQTGIFWGVHSGATFPWRENRFIRWDQLPVALRYGISRVSKTQFDAGGCVAEHMGSLLVAKEHTSCKGLIWRELRYRKSPTKEGSPEAVQMYPKCEKLDDVFSPEPKCLGWD